MNLVFGMQIDMNDRNKVFLKNKTSFGQIGSLWIQKWHILITLDPLLESFKTLHNKRGQQVDDINNFSQKGSCLGQMDQFGRKNGPSS